MPSVSACNPPRGSDYIHPLLTSPCLYALLQAMVRHLAVSCASSSFDSLGSTPPPLPPPLPLPLSTTATTTTTATTKTTPIPLPISTGDEISILESPPITEPHITYKSITSSFLSLDRCLNQQDRPSSHHHHRHHHRRHRQQQWQWCKG